MAPREACPADEEPRDPDLSSEGSPSSEAAESAASTAEPGCAESSNDEVGVLCVGVMRTGLKTLHKALRGLGYENIYDQEDIVSTYEHWDAVLRNRAPKDAFAAMFKGKEVVMGMPTFCFWEEILELYPNAQVILTVRDEDEWWSSVLRAKHLMDRDLPGEPLRHGLWMRRIESFLMPSYHKFCEVLRFAWSTTLGANALEGSYLNEFAARSSYRRHNSYVRAALEGKCTPTGRPRLLLYDVREGWGPLSAFLEREPPVDTAFPAVMEVPYFPGDEDDSASASGCDEPVRAESSELIQPKVIMESSNELEELLHPHTTFGATVRKELRAGLLGCLVLLAIVLSAILLAARLGRAAEAPLVFGTLAYAAVATVGWSAYVTVHGLVSRVPALLVLPLAVKSLLIAAALHVCFISYGVLKEMLVTEDKIASPVLVLSSRLMSILCASAWLLATESRIQLAAPLRSMSAFALTNEMSSWAGYEMLKYVSFPVQVMAKSCKTLPNMIMGRVLRGTRYSFYQYVQALAAMVCVAVLHFSDDHSKEETSKDNLIMGVALLILFFACDSFTSQWQTALYKRYPATSQTQMMLGGNILGFIFTSGSIVCSWGRVSASVAVALDKPEVLGRILALGAVSALGQFCIYTAIRILGPLSFTWIMTARQLLSVLISLVFFGHGVDAAKLLCILIVFAIMSSKQLQRVVPRRAPCKKRSRASGRMATPRGGVVRAALEAARSASQKKAD